MSEAIAVECLGIIGHKVYRIGLKRSRMGELTDESAQGLDLD
jgi:hypothetical protein